VASATLGLLVLSGGEIVSVRLRLRGIRDYSSWSGRKHGRCPGAVIAGAGGGAGRYARSRQPGRAFGLVPKARPSRPFLPPSGVGDLARRGMDAAGPHDADHSWARSTGGFHTFVTDSPGGRRGTAPVRWPLRAPSARLSVRAFRIQRASCKAGKVGAVRMMAGGWPAAVRRGARSWKAAKRGIVAITAGQGSVNMTTRAERPQNGGNANLKGRDRRAPSAWTPTSEAWTISAKPGSQGWRLMK